MKVTVENFQSIEKVTLDIQGFTTITGDSNIGKSALVRAIRFALTNAAGTYFVRHTPQCGKTETRKCKCVSRVHLQSEGLDLLWEKGDLCSRYVVNGVTYDKPGKGQLDFLNDLGFSTAKVGSDMAMLQSAPQFKPIFLIDQSGPAIAESIADVSKLQRVNQASKAADRERREVAAALKTSESIVADTKLSLLPFDRLGGVQEMHSRVSDLEALAVKSMSKLDALSTYLARVTDTLEGRKRLESFLLGLASDVDPTAEAVESWKVASSCFRRALALRSALTTLTKVEEVTPPKVSEVESRYKKLTGLLRYIGRYRHIVESAQKASSIQIPAPSGDLSEFESKLRIYRNLSSYQAKLARIDRSDKELNLEMATVAEEESRVAKELSALPKVCLECGRAYHQGEHSS